MPQPEPPHHRPAVDLAPGGPSADALIDEVWPRLSDELLRDIARAPWVGDAALHEQGLRAFRDDRHTMDTSDWAVHPSEALEIGRWRLIEDAAGTLSVAEQHRRRLACCSALVYAAGHDVMSDSSEIETVGALVESSLALGPLHTEQAARLLAWRLDQCPPDHSGAFEKYLALGLVLLAVASRHNAPDQLALASWVVDHDAAATPGPWRLREAFNQRGELWSSLLTGALSDAEPAVARLLDALIPNIRRADEPGSSANRRPMNRS